MSFWFYAFWYLLIGVLMDTGWSNNSKPALWSMLLWPLILAAAIIMHIHAAFSEEEPRRYE